MNIGNTIKTLRTAAGVRQTVLAKRIGVTPSYLSLIESNAREPSLTTLKAISRALEVPLSVLIFEASDLPNASSSEEIAEYKHIKDLAMQVLLRMMSKNRPCEG